MAIYEPLLVDPFVFNIVSEGNEGVRLTVITFVAFFFQSDTDVPEMTDLDLDVGEEQCEGKYVFLEVA